MLWSSVLAANMLCLCTGPAKAAASASLRELHPVGKAIETGNLKVSDVHMIHYQIYGNPQGQPALVVHGGPGAGCYANHAYVHCNLPMHTTVCSCHTLNVESCCFAKPPVGERPLIMLNMLSVGQHLC